MINNFEAGHRLLNAGAVSLDTRHPTFQNKLDLFFVDNEWVPLLVQESYLAAMKDSMDLEAMADAAEYISLGDSLNR